MNPIPSASWESAQMAALVEEYALADARLILVIGGADTGKTTLVAELADRLSKDDSIGVVDSDIGQSHLGPPATVGWGRIEGSFNGWDAVRLEDYYFAGAISPPGNLLQLLTGAALMTRRALAECGKAIVDTTGMIDEPAGLVLKQQKLDMLAPDVVIGIEKKDELKAILAPFLHLKCPLIHVLPSPEGIRAKSVTERMGYRHDRFGAYFRDAAIVTLNLHAMGLRFTRGQESATEDNLIGRLASLRDSNNRDLSLGIIEDFSAPAAKLKLRTPCKDSGKAAAVVVGQTVDVL